MKTRIFIGSSSEGLEIAEKVKSFFDIDFECYLWTDDIFKYNENFLETLMKEASLFDFGLMVFTKDDYTTSRLVSFDSARDNVMFEYGLFLGRLGKDNAYIIKDKEVKLPSDLLGISNATFDCVKDSDGKLILDENSLFESLGRLKTQIEEKVHLGVLGMLPSTVLAIGYFYNFIEPVCNYLGDGNVVSIGNKEYSKFKFKVILPKDLDSDLKKRANSFYRKKKYEPLQIPTTSRSYPLYVAIDTDNGTLNLSDMPTTLSGIDRAIEMYLRKGHIGKSSEQQLLEERELKNFEAVLRHLIEADAYCKDLIEIEIEN